MKIQQVNIKKFKKIEDFEMNFNGQNVIICGKNELGKSSIMQFIGIALGDQTNIPPNALGEGEVVTTKGGKKFTFKVELKDGKPKVTVEIEGLRDSRKGTLEMICGAMGFNIYEFVEQSKSVAGRKKQIETIKSFLPEETRNDLAKYEADILAKYEERTGLNKDLKNILGTIQTHPLFNLTEKELKSLQKTDVATVFESLKKIEEENKKVIEVETRLKSREQEIVEHSAEIKELEEKIEKLKETVLEKESLNVKANEWLKSNSIKDTSEFQNQIQEANITNDKYTRSQELIGMYSKKSTLEEQVGELTAQIESGREAISEAVKECANIIEGLSFDNDGLLLNGIPVSPSSLSTSQIMKLGYRLHVLKNPESPIFLEGMESFDKDKLRELFEFAKQEDVQIIGEKVEIDTNEIRFELIPIN